jgi:hypothetical protein
MSDKLRLYHLLADNPHWIGIVKEGFAVEEKYGRDHPKDKYPDAEWLGFEWFEVHCQPATLNKMVTERVLDVSYSSHSSTYYKVADSGLIKEVITMLESPPDEEERVEGEIPDDIFSPVIGYEDIKQFLAAALKGGEEASFPF